MLGKKRRSHLFTFFRLKRAIGKDKHTAGSDQGCGVVKQPGLHGGKSGYILAILRVGDIGMTPNGPCGRTGCVDKHAIESLTGLICFGTRVDEMCIELQSIKIAFKALKPCL